VRFLSCSFCLLSFFREKPLLRKRGKVLRRVVEIQSGCHVCEHKRHHYRKHVAHHLRLWIRRRISQSNPREQIHRNSHQDGQDVDGILDGDVCEPEEWNSSEFDCVLKDKEQCEQHRHWNQHGQTP